MKSPKDWSPAEDAQEKALAAENRAIETLQAMNEGFKAKYPEIGLSFGYIGNLDIRYDDRSWMFFTQVMTEGTWGPQRMTFGGYPTAELPEFAKKALDPERGLENFIKTRVLPRAEKERGGTMNGPKDWSPHDLSPDDPRVVELAQRIQKAVELADLAYWEKISESFPEVTGGDLSPGAAIEWTAATWTAVLSWLSENYQKTSLLKPILDKAREEWDG